jgi:ABC-2 type transport system permease protein
MSIEAIDQTRIMSARAGLGEQLIDVWKYRQLLVILVRTQLKVKYKNSALGFAWSMLNPALYIVVFYIVFELILQNGIPNFPIYLLSGLLVWNLFSAALAGGTGSIVAAAGIVKKVYFPRVILPLAAVGAGLVHFFLQALVLGVALIAFQYSVGWQYIYLVPLALVVLLILSSALAVALGAVNVRMRDTGHFVELALLAWFWMTPIIYPVMLVLDRDSPLIYAYQLNPVVWVVVAFQRAIYNKTTARTINDGVVSITKILPAGADGWWYTWHLLIVGAVAIALLLAAVAMFGRREGNFSEDL